MGSVCREVVTLQLGHYANYVGTHWWNLQDASLRYDADPHNLPSEVRSDALFREGLTQSGQTTYTPRLIALDLKGSLNTLRQEGTLYELHRQGSTLTWEGEVMTHEEEQAVKNVFLQDLERLDQGEVLAEGEFSQQQREQCRGAEGSVNASVERTQKLFSLEGSVRVWSDFLRIHLHPRSISVIHQYNHDGETNRMEAFGQGEALLREPLFLEELEDRLHFFVEECDYLQGFQVLCDLQDGFSGLGSGVTELLHDEYRGRGVFTWGLGPITHSDTSPVKDVFHLLNSVLGVVSLSNHSSLFCPLSLRGGLGRRPPPHITFPHLQYDPSLWYHSSAVLATALDTLTLPYRTLKDSATMGQLADAFAVSGRKVVTACGAVPFPMMLGDCLPNALAGFGEALPWKPLSACGEQSDGRCFAQSVSLRGVEGQSLVSQLAPGTQPPSPLHCYGSGEDVLTAYLQERYPSTPSVVHLVQSPCKLMTPFPQIFTPTLGKHGFLESGPRPASTPVDSVPVLTCLQSSPLLHRCLSELHSEVSALDLQRFCSFLSAGTELDDLREALQDLKALAQHYKMNSDLDASSEEESD
ncbi:protein misato homolog 1-like isoform X1 [Acipenser ruthenus]|uniref:protein misato homolog 1-like isoform X1 n=1 Tax=Acipenser ruthenus TaxID=7906 RepID=UPI0027406B2A|nr:protein misato homolog 1-like isoform X1 [Acipenser ruthenus]